MDNNPKAKFKGIIYSDGFIAKDEDINEVKNSDNDVNENIDEAKLWERFKEAEEFISISKIIK